MDELVKLIDEARESRDAINQEWLEKEICRIGIQESFSEIFNEAKQQYGLLREIIEEQVQCSEENGINFGSDVACSDFFTKGLMNLKMEASTYQGIGFPCFWRMHKMLYMHIDVSSGYLEITSEMGGSEPEKYHLVYPPEPGPPLGRHPFGKTFSSLDKIFKCTSIIWEHIIRDDPDGLHPIDDMLARIPKVLFTLPYMVERAIANSKSEIEQRQQRYQAALGRSIKLIE